MTNYTKGRAFEYQVMRYLRKRGWMVARTAGSHGPFDIFAARNGKTWLIQAKMKGKLTLHELAKLLKVANASGALPILVSRQKGKGMLFRLVKPEGGSS